LAAGNCLASTSKKALFQLCQYCQMRTAFVLLGCCNVQAQSFVRILCSKVCTWNVQETGQAILLWQRSLVSFSHLICCFSCFNAQR